MVVRSHAGLAGGAGWLEEQFDGGVSQEKLGAPAGRLASSPTVDMLVVSDSSHNLSEPHFLLCRLGLIIPALIREGAGACEIRGERPLGFHVWLPGA